MKLAIVAFLASVVIRILCFTWSVRIKGPEPPRNGSSLVFCFWHGRQAGLFAYPRPRKTAVMSSLSRDGELQAQILTRLGFSVCRGSSSRGASEGLKAMVNRVNSGEDAAFAVDGPRGPAFKVKPGAVLTACQTGATLVPITFGASSSWVFKKAWDNYLLPKPFSKVTILRGDPILADGKDTESLRTTLEQALSSLDNSHNKS